MKANVLYGIGDLRYVDVPMPEVAEGQVLLKVRAVGICGSDNARVFKTGTYHFPTIIGHEFSGEVVQAEDRQLVGRRAAVYPLIPCGKCDSCKRSVFETCSHYNYLGSRCDGAFAEYVAVPIWNLAFLPDKVTDEEAAMLEPSCVAYHALRRSGFAFGDTVAVFGPGTIGMILCMLARMAGAKKVFLIGRTQEKLDFARQNGIVEDVCNSSETDIEEWINEATDGKGVDIAFEGTGASATLEHCLLITRPLGTVLAMGNPQGDMVLGKDAYWKLLRKQLRMIGTWNSSFGSYPDDWKSVIDLLEQGRLPLAKLITHRLALPDLIKGLEMMHEKSEYCNKIMIINNGQEG